MHTFNLVLKRFADIVVSLIGIITLTIIPVFIVVPILIRLTSEGPAIYKQVRIGKNQKKFMMYKFRTMIVEQYDQYGNEIMSENRITKIGRFLRTTSLDETPQLFNVLFGNMSLIGPRPMLEYQAERCIADELQRFTLRPGITGLAQIMGRNNMPWEERIKFDVEYVNKANIFLDLSIIVKTILMVFKRDGTDVKPEYRGNDRFSKHYSIELNDKSVNKVRENQED